MASSPHSWLRPWLPLRVPASRAAQTRVILGGLTAGALLLQALSGVLLLVHYRPGLTLAQSSTRLLMQQVPYGAWLLAGHRLMGHAVVALVMMHGVTALWSGAIRRPRHTTFFVGVALGLLVLIELYTGTLLPWREDSLRAAQVGLGLLGTVPLVGTFLANLARAGATLSDASIQQFWFVHAVGLPLLMGTLAIVHVLFVHARGLFRGARERTVPYWPHVASIEAWWLAMIGTGILVLAAIFPTLGARASASSQGAHLPSWPFLPVYAIVERLPMSTDTPALNAITWGVGTLVLSATFGIIGTLAARASDEDASGLTMLRAITLGAIAGVLALGIWGALA